jgi:monovalent cation/hydrogen antiporter
MEHSELVVAGLLLAVVILSALARRLSVPYPIVLVLGGAAMGFIPGLPHIELSPEAVLLVFLPPLLYGASIFASVADIRANLRPLTLNTVGLVLATMCAVAAAAHLFIPGMSWQAAFVLGAIVSPTDPLAAAVIMRRVGAPRRLVSSVEAEGLFNDATALVAYRVAVAAVVAGTFSLWDATTEFIIGALTGVAIGFAVGWLLAEIRRRTTDAPLNVAMSLLTGYVAFIPADALGASGVLAAVTAGLLMSVRGPRTLPARVRLQSVFVWEVLDFLVNAVLFVLIGLQLQGLTESLSEFSALTLIASGLLVSLVVFGTRLAWLFTVPYIIRALDRRPQQRARRVGARPRLVLAWSGMRGAVSLAVALALPATTESGAPFPQRDLTIFLTFAVIFFTLVLQGLSLPTVIRRLGVTEGEDDMSEEVRARLVATEAALKELETLATADWTRDETVERLQRFYEYRKERFAARAGKIEDAGFEEQTLAYQRTLQHVLAAQRQALSQMHRSGDVSSEVMLRILRELDLEESRLEI